ncbi:MAG: carboxypeptidase-like regulatory domain-containing protein, partial [Pseudomonadota bacterium]|nr:carboxypeptidase-like regulatory domain-containing protein [Pseudomonadota bacterium]
MSGAAAGNAGITHRSLKPVPDLDNTSEAEAHMQATRSNAALTDGLHSPWRWPLVSALMLVVAACGGGGSDSTLPAPTAASTGSISGTVVGSSSGAALSGVAVKSAGRSASTAADGSYTLTEVPTGDGKVIAFELAGHAKGVLAVSVTAGATSGVNARLTRVGATQTFDAATATTIVVAGSSAQVSLPAAGFVTATGATASGMVTAEVTPINPAIDPGNMPGNYTALAAGSNAPQQIESFGALSVTL